MNTNDKWDGNDVPISETTDNLRKAVQDGSMIDFDKSLAKSMAHIQQQMNTIGRSIVNSGKINAKNLPLPTPANTSFNKGGVIGEGSVDARLEKHAVWNTRNKFDENNIVPSSHVRNRILDDLKLPRYTDNLNIRSVTIYEDPSQKKNKVYYLAVNGGHRVAVYYGGQGVLEILDMDVCSSAVLAIGVFRLTSYDDDKLEYSCNVVSWHRFVQIMSTAITYENLPTIGHKYASNEIAEVTALEGTFENEYPVVPENGDVLALINREGKNATLNVYRNIEGRSVIDTVLWLSYNQDNSVRVYAWLDSIGNFGTEVYDETMRYLRNLGIPNNHGDRLVEFNVRDGIINTPLGFAEQFMNIIAGFNQYRADYATDYAYVVYRNKIRNKA